MVLCGVLSNTVEEWKLPVDVLPPSAFTTNVQTKPAASQAHHAHPFLCLAYQVEHSVYCEAYLQSLSECQKWIYIKIYIFNNLTWLVWLYFLFLFLSFFLFDTHLDC